MGCLVVVEVLPDLCSSQCQLTVHQVLHHTGTRSQHTQPHTGRGKEGGREEGGKEQGEEKDDKMEGQRE